ncbi:ABC transporter permease subunit [Bosea sp. TAB14]|uniref:ABC transporter permease n=1 Tax=Bosea sp. TAB14 TaxID=3237481 RepID=UPI003F9135FE
MFVLRRLGGALPTLFAVSLLVFLFVDLIPGDPAQILAGPTASNEEIEIATRPAAMFSRLVAASLTETMGKDYLDTARAKGLSETRVVLAHALRNSLIAAVSVAGVQFGGMLGGSVVTETVFGIPGVGRLLVDAVSRADYPVIQYAILMFAVFFVVINLVTDLLTQWLDPRTREQERPA